MIMKSRNGHMHGLSLTTPHPPSKKKSFREYRHLFATGLRDKHQDYVGKIMLLHIFILLEH